jgi:hypothetical protein
MWGYSLCQHCGKIELLGDTDTLGTETEGVFVHWQATAVDDKEDQGMLTGQTVDLFLSLESPPLCDECLKEINDE